MATTNSLLALLGFACLLLVGHGAVLESPESKANPDTAFEFVGTVEGKIFLIANQLGVMTFIIYLTKPLGYSI